MFALDRCSTLPSHGKRRLPGLCWAMLLLPCAAPLAAADKEPPAVDTKHVVPPAGTFPATEAGVYYAGELVSVDHVHRYGALRLVGDNDDGRYHSAPSHRFALLPYGTVRYHGAPAELRDVPIGTVLHGVFLVPNADLPTYPPIEKKTSKYVPKETQALTLEDDFSFYERQGQAWKIVAVDVAKGVLSVSASGMAATRGLTGDQAFEIDASTRIWKGRAIGALADLAADQVVQLNLTWAPDWKNGKFHVADIWIDEESRGVARELQRQIHIRHQKTRWLTGWVDHVDHQSGGSGIVTVTLFGGMDPVLYETVRAQAKPGGGAAIAAAEWTLQSWWQDHDAKHGKVLRALDTAYPPPGSSGMQVQVEFKRLLDGYRPGRIIRLRPNGFPNVKLPPEERVNSLDER